MCKRFVYGVAVSDYKFIGREQETKRLLDNFRGGYQRHIDVAEAIGKDLVGEACLQ